MLVVTPACDERRDDVGVLEQGNQSEHQGSFSKEGKRKKTGGVTKYKLGKTTLWRVDVWLKLPDQSVIRFRKRKIPTREQAEALVAKRRAEAFEGQHFRRVKTIPLTVRDAWKTYEPVCQRNHKDALTEKCRSQHLLRHLGNAKVQALSIADVDRYRAQRLAERSIRGKAPASSTLDYEVELLKRLLNYAVECGVITVNPIAKAKLLRKPNVRTSVINEEIFRRLSDACEPALKPILTVAFDTGMRKREILNLRWEQVDLKLGIIRLAPQDTKGKEHRPVYMTSRVRSLLSAIPRHLHSKHVFLNPKTMSRWRDIDRMFQRARRAIGMEGVWFHDMRRSFITKARRAGVPESVVMKMSGHRTREVFERYNIVSETDLEEAVRRLENFGHVLDKVDESVTSGAAKS